MTKHLYTTLGPKCREEIGIILPHEHVFVDLRVPDATGYAQADIDEVVMLMAPQIEAIKAQGVTALVECTTSGVGRRADIDLAVSQATDFPIVVPTGNYREPWIPAWIASATEDALERWMVSELTDGIEDSGVVAGWIKLSAGDDGITPLEARILRAAARASVQTDAVIGSHTIRGRVAMEQLNILEAEGCSAGRFISIHTQEEKDFELHRALVDRGAWIEYDHVGRAPDDELVGMVTRAIESQLVHHLLLSHDAGWYDPAQPGGGVPKPYTHLISRLMPSLKVAGVDEALLSQITEANPFEAFAR
ncbi:phosphotriesterase family protein [Rhizobium sullae]|uniref:Phosphotriesterase-related protein n=1 Tax=Rhizobium sullae TaxID=50338 RepID=A0A4R3PSX9_RHISU|nr:esterase [Rhizobium sullae]TCU05356.1 phosphotriesterase-related protein [Rhizobium sullae]